MAETSAPQQSSLLLLPTELRHRVWFHLFDWPESTIRIGSGRSHSAESRRSQVPNTKILSVCRQICNEATPVLMTALMNKKLYIDGTVKNYHASTIRFLEKFGGSFRHVKTSVKEIGIARSPHGLLAGMSTLQLEFSEELLQMDDSWGHLEQSDHKHGDCHTVLRSQCFDEAIWKTWDLYVAVRGFQQAGMYDSGLLQLLRSKRGQDRRFRLIVSQAFAFYDDDTDMTLTARLDLDSRTILKARATMYNVENDEVILEHRRQNPSSQ